MGSLTFPDYFSAVYIINLPDRTDRLRSVKAELTALGFEPNGPEVHVPFAPVVQDANGFSSTGVYGNFLSHLSILRDVQEKGHERALVLEDDAIFRSSLRRPEVQAEAIASADRFDWTMWFIGHRLRQGLKGETDNVVPTQMPFTWAHCYCVHRRGISDLVSYLEATDERPAGDPMGGKMYIDGAFGLFRKFHPQNICLVSNPSMSIQKGSNSDLAAERQSWAKGSLRIALETARQARDAIWRQTGIDFRSGF